MNNISPTTPLCDRWNAFLLSGFFMIILGTIALSAAFWTTMATAMFLGALLLAGGLTSIFHSFWTGQWKGFFSEFAIGILMSSVGFLMVANPGIGAASLTLLLAAFFITAGLFRIGLSLRHKINNWGWTLLNGIISLSLGILILLKWPSSALWILGLFIAINLLVSGWTHIMFALALRKSCNLKSNA